MVDDKVQFLIIEAVTISRDTVYFSHDGFGMLLVELVVDYPASALLLGVFVLALLPDAVHQSCDQYCQPGFNTPGHLIDSVGEIVDFPQVQPLTI